MADFAYTVMKADLWRGTLDFDSDTFKIILVITGSTAGTEEDKTRISGGSGFTTLNEAAGYTRPTLGSLLITQDDPNDQGEWDVGNVSISSVPAQGGDDLIGMLIYKDVGGNDADSIPLLFIDSGGFPITPNGSDIDITFATEGLAKTT